MSVAATTKALLCAIHDSVMLLAPGGWSTVQLEFVLTQRGWRLQSLTTEGVGGIDPKPLPDLGVDQKLEAQRLSGAVDELASLQQLVDRGWDQTRVKIDRSSREFTDFKFLGAADSTAWFSRLEISAVKSLLISDELFDVLRGTEAASKVLQTQYDARMNALGAHSLEPETGALVLTTTAGESLRIAAQLVGFYDPDSFRWTWAWADARWPKIDRSLVRRVCAPDVPQDGLSAFGRSTFHCDEGFALALASSMIVSLGARGLAKVVTGNGTVAVYAVVEST